MLRQDDPTPAADFNEPDFIFSITRKVVVVNLDVLAEFPQRLGYNPLTRERSMKKTNASGGFRARARSGWPLRCRCACGHNPQSILRLYSVQLQLSWESLSRLKPAGRKKCADR
jgi:hypothetical protein